VPVVGGTRTQKQFCAQTVTETCSLRRARARRVDLDYAWAYCMFSRAVVCASMGELACEWNRSLVSFKFEGAVTVMSDIMLVTLGPVQSADWTGGATLAATVTVTHHVPDVNSAGVRPIVRC
jgi:hypothetical protein